MERCERVKEGKSSMENEGVGHFAYENRDDASGLNFL